MPLILAIEPDRRQAARITALGRGTLRAELLVADSTENGIAALHGRTPDLILTSLLLSPKDEAGLHALDNGGVPVPTLMIPMLASSSSSAEGRGGLRARLRWSKPAAAVSSDGCDPQVFAGQIQEYLSRVQEAQEIHEIREASRHREDQGVREVPATRAVPAPEPADVQPAPEFETPFADPPAVASSPELYAFDAPEEPQAPAVVEDYVAIPEVVAIPDAVATHHVVAVPEFVDVAEAHGEMLAAPEELAVTAPPAIEVSATLPESEVLAVEEGDAIASGLKAAEESLAADEREVEVEVEVTVAGWDETALAGNEDDATIELSNESVDLQAFVEELNATYADLYPHADRAAEPVRQAARTPEPARVQPIHEAFVVPHAASARQADKALPIPEVQASPAKTLVTVAHELPLRVSWPSLEGMAAEDAQPLDMTEVVADFVAALVDDDDSEPDNPGQGDPDSDLWMPLSAPPGAFWPRLESTCSRSGKPLQDEWGFFDPDQCGFSALVAKLDSMTR